ncbi:DUF4402 domain-containing protein [Halobacteriovorax sp. GB3]|uniref:DUF4402 domain-containing protein n=1 Tax=Halobacteriovorax sp. GB3 TaxID=2719615 RepID=UPI00235F5A3F|nr:DUF4402 domain-containing protein [Halobacteriovorax sp. GB3]MDD0852053.1 DUF4402 domain-containing protein [Halobacteriovorax sp. GB3]
MKSLFLILLFLSISNLTFGLTVTTTQNLNFGTLVQGDSAKTIRPSKADTNNARFDIVGEPNRSFMVILPSEVELFSASTPSQTLKVGSFKSRPNISGSLNRKGKKELRVGAKLQKIPNGQASGSYFGYFIVDVIY